MIEQTICAGTHSLYALPPDQPCCDACSQGAAPGSQGVLTLPRCMFVSHLGPCTLSGSLRAARKTKGCAQSMEWGPVFNHRRGGHSQAMLSGVRCTAFCTRLTPDVPARCFTHHDSTPTSLDHVNPGMQFVILFGRPHSTSGRTASLLHQAAALHRGW